MKKFISLICVLAIALSMVTFVSADVAEYIVNENFDSWTTIESGKYIGPFKVHTNLKNFEISNGSLKSGVNAADTSAMMLLGDTGHGNPVTYIKGKGVLEFSFKQDVVGQAGCLFWLTDSTSGNGPKLAIDANLNLITWNGNSSNTALTAVKAGEWYKITIAFDAATAKFDLYLNGELKADDYAFPTASTYNGSICRAKIDINAGCPSVYYDNFKLYEGELDIPEVDEDDASIVDENFDDWTTIEKGNYIGPFKVHTNLANMTIENGALKSGANASVASAMMLLGDTGHGNPVTYIKGKGVLEFSFKQDVVGQAGCLFWLTDSTSGNGPKLAIDANLNLITWNGNSSNTALTAVKAGEWYKITIAFDAATAKFDLYLNGELKADDYAFPTASTYNGSICRAKIDINANCPSVYYDNFKLYEGELEIPEVDEEDTSIVNENFDDWATIEKGNYIGPFKVHTNLANMTIENGALKSGVDASAKSALMLLGDQGNPATYITGKGVLEFSFKQDVVGQAGCLLQLTDSTSGNGPKLAIDANLNLITWNGNSSYTTLTAVQAGVWYKITIAFDAATAKFDLYLNGELKADDYAFPTASTYNGSICRMKLDINAGCPSVYYDNFKLYEGELDIPEVDEEDASIVDENFDDWTTIEKGNYIGPFKVHTNLANMTVENGALKSGANASAASSMLLLGDQGNPAQALTGENTFEFKFKQDVVGQAGCLLQLTDSSSGNGPKIAINENNKLVIWNGKSTWELGTPEAGKWYDVKIEFDATAATYDFYLDGVKKADNFGFFTESTYNGNICRMKVVINAGCPSVYYDDIKLYAGIQGSINTIVSVDLAAKTVTGKTCGTGEIAAEDEAYFVTGVYLGNKLMKMAVSKKSDYAEVPAYYTSTVDINNLGAGKYTAKSYIVADLTSLKPLTQSATAAFEIAE